MSNIELFLDRHRISWEHNIARRLNHPVRCAENPILAGEHPWEESFVVACGNVLPRKGGGFRMWYNAGAGGHQGAKVLCYAESDDGIHWQRVMHNAEPYEGHSPTNIVFGPRPTVPEPCVIENQHDDSDERFLLMFNPYPKDFPQRTDMMQGSRWCFTATSADGIHWSPARPAIPGKADAPISIVWDPAGRRYLAYLRGTRTPHRPFDENAPHGESVRVRYARVAVSADFKRWSDPIEILRLDEMDNDPYGQVHQLSVTRRDGQYVGLLSLMHVHGYRWFADRDLLMEEGVTEAQLAVSRDGLRWDRAADRQTFFPLGAPGQWDSAWLVTLHNIVYDGERMLFYYNATDKGRGDMPAYRKESAKTSNFRLGVAELPRDRFQALSPRQLHDHGVIETRPMSFTERGQLRLNADATHGRIEVELCDYHGVTIEGFSRGDCTPIEETEGLDLPVTWGERTLTQAIDRASINRRAIRVRIYLKCASLFAADFPAEHPWPVARDYGA